MGLKMLHSADWHLDSPFRGFTEAQRRLLKQKQRKIPGMIADLCRREECDLVLLAGDLFDGEASRETLDVLKNALAACKVPVLISPGNHDYCAPGSPWLEENWPENVYIFTGGLESIVIEALDCRVYGAGYQSMDCPALLEGFRTVGEEQYQVAVLHADPLQAKSPACPITTAQVRDSRLDYLALGHIHKAGAFRTGKTLCAWPGCPMGRGWDETGEKGVCIVTLGEAVDIQAVSLDTLRFYEQNVEVENDAAAALEMALPGAPGDDFYRISLVGSGEVDIPGLKQRFSRFPNLELLDRTETPVDLWAETDEDSLEGIYFAMLRKAMEAEPDKAEQIRLAAEISRKLLSGREVIL